MNYLVCIKQVPDTTTRFQLNENQKEVDLSSVKWIINPYDEFAIEEAVRFSEQDSQKGIHSKIWGVSVGPKRVMEALRTALAMGVHEGIHIESDHEPDSLMISHAIDSVLKERFTDIDIIFCGHHSIDWNQSAIGSMLAQQAGYPSFGPVHKIEREEDGLKIHRALNQKSTEVLKIQTPVALCVTKGINEPRYPSLPAIMKAKNKPIHHHKVPHGQSPFFSIHSLSFPKERPPVQMIEGSPKEQAKQLIQVLKEKENLL